MTEPLRPELEELLPCSGSSPQCDAHDPARCTPCRERPAILAWVQRKLDEAKADGELLAKVEAWCHQSGARITITSAYPDPGAQRIRIRYGQGRASTAPTLVDALRKLVAVEP